MSESVRESVIAGQKEVSVDTGGHAQGGGGGWPEGWKRGLMSN